MASIMLVSVYYFYLTFWPSLQLVIPGFGTGLLDVTQATFQNPHFQTKGIKVNFALSKLLTFFWNLLQPTSSIFRIKSRPLEKFVPLLVLLRGTSSRTSTSRGLQHLVAATGQSPGGPFSSTIGEGTSQHLGHLRKQNYCLTQTF